MKDELTTSICRAKTAPEKIIAACEKSFGITHEQMKEHRTHVKFKMARNAAIFLIRTNSQTLTNGDIAAMFNRTHPAVTSASRFVREKVRTNDWFRNVLSSIEVRIHD